MRPGLAMAQKALSKIVFSSFITGYFLFAVSAVAIDEGGQKMELTSPEFKNNDFIPKKFSAEGEDINPPLDIEGIPEGAKSLALIVEDPDAPAGTWVHWVVYDMPVVPTIDEDSAPGRLGANDSNRDGRYGGPYPPPGRPHRYIFKIYALDKVIGLKELARKDDLERAMKGHILDKAELIGIYKR